jgi:release factor glutamine methyltransferase
MKNLQQQIEWILQEKYNGRMTAAAKKDIARLKAGEPIDHIIGFMDFLGCKILANKDALIPRVETEFWVEQVIDVMSYIYVTLHKRKIRVLDMFAGSGAIGIAIMRHIKHARVTFAESEKGAVEQIKKNCVLNKIPAQRYEIIQSDIFEQLHGPTVQYFDYILANPPYIPKTRATKIQKSVIDYEPHAALFGGEDGLEFVRRFLAEAKNRLNPSTGSGQAGKIYMEFDCIQKRQINALLKKLEYHKWDFHRDQYGKVRYVVVQ